MSYAGLLQLAAPEVIVTLVALAVLAADLFALRDLDTPTRMLLCAAIAAVGCLGAAAWSLIMPQHANVMDGMFVVDPLVQFVQVCLLGLTIVTILLSIGAGFTDHVGEYFSLILFATVGMMFLVSTENILMIFLALELTSLCLYLLTAFNKRNIRSAEAALKYFLFGGMAAAFTLFGLSLIYGLSGATNLVEISKALAAKMTSLEGKVAVDPLLATGLVMTVIGFGFKIAAAPFHLWAPDAYEGAPAPSAALIASGSKVAGFFVLAKVMMLGFDGIPGSGAWRQFATGWTPLLAGIAAASMILGNLAAIVQTSVRRLLAYSAIAHSGYVLTAVLPHSEAGLASLVFYIVTYGLTAIGAFGVVAVVEQNTGGSRLTDFAGLSRREPLVAAAMLVFLLSLAGIPPLAGFFGKFYVFSVVVGADGGHLGLLWLVILAIAMSVVSLYYYLQVLKQIYVADPAGNFPNPSNPPAPILSRVLLTLIALAVVLFGCAPNLLLAPLTRAFSHP